ncbi:hypothetical protein DFH07DRAFT_936988 [Mycena maculata]|uniref:Uncharacterized protein n=1 Tax=Mycena maculata TaxID=230809 RepID=A0AAD7K163_9AGAR|nr:hypothetical protein DFH07DRAFT_936988 [Mycena maculata]
MKDPNATSIPRSANLSRFRPLSLPVYLDYKPFPKRAAPIVIEPPASPRPYPAPQKPAQPPPSGFHISGIPRILRPGTRPSLLAKPSPPPPPPSPYADHPQQNESRCRQMLIPGLFVAFEDDFVASGVPKREALRADGGRPFTHFISLSPRHAAPIRTSVDRATGARRLRLKLPALYSPSPPTPAELDAKLARARAARGGVLDEGEYYDVLFDEGEDSGDTGLEALQLLAARDFLYAARLDRDRGARVLVTAPRDHRTDTIAVVMGYLALVLGHRVARVLRAQDAHPGILGIWKGAISDECAAFIEENIVWMWILLGCYHLVVLRASLPNKHGLLKLRVSFLTLTTSPIHLRSFIFIPYMRAALRPRSGASRSSPDLGF